MSRTTAYQFTTTDREDPRITDLKTGIAAINKMNREDYRHGYSNSISLYRVRLMPRGPRVDAARSDYGSSRAYDSYLPQRYATSFDVYIHRDTTAEYQLKRERETGLTAGQLRRIDREEHALMMAKFDMHQRLRDAGIHLEGNEYMSREKKYELMVTRGVPYSVIERIL